MLAASKDTTSLMCQAEAIYVCCALLPASSLQVFQEDTLNYLLSHCLQATQESNCKDKLSQHATRTLLWEFDLSAASLRRLTRSFTKGASGEACKPAGG